MRNSLVLSIHVTDLSMQLSPQRILERQMRFYVTTVIRQIVWCPDGTRMHTMRSLENPGLGGTFTMNGIRMIRTLTALYFEMSLVSMFIYIIQKYELSTNVKSNWFKVGIILLLCQWWFDRKNRYYLNHKYFSTNVYFHQVRPQKMFQKLYIKRWVVLLLDYESLHVEDFVQWKNNVMIDKTRLILLKMAIAMVVKYTSSVHMFSFALLDNNVNVVLNWK